jgi:hypothetical protein
MPVAQNQRVPLGVSEEVTGQKAGRRIGITRSKGKTQKSKPMLLLLLTFAFCVLHFDWFFHPLPHR